jgi:hypothetical protein
MYTYKHAHTYINTHTNMFIIAMNIVAIILIKVIITSMKLLGRKKQHSIRIEYEYK